VGTGTLTLRGLNTYTGATNVNAGWLLVDGALGNTAVTVNSGGAFGGSGTIGGSVSAGAGTFLSPGTEPFTGATMTINGGLTLNGPTLFFDMSSTPAGANDRIAMNGGTLALNGTQNFQFLLLEGTLAAGTYDLITGATNSTVNNAILTHNLPANSRQTFALSRTAAGANPSFVRLTVTGNPATLTWTGNTSSAWDTTTTGNWAGATPGTFFAHDAVVIDDTATSTTILPSGSIIPRSTLVNNSAKAITLGGGLDAGTLTKTGTNTLTLTGANAYGGGMNLNGGTVQLANDIANNSGLGTGPITFRGGILRMAENNSTYNDSTWNLVVPSGETGTLWQDGRSSIHAPGSLGPQ
jgi:fibronectin-binding autotransporter adhesin